MLQKHYESPDLFTGDRVNFYSTYKSLCGIFIGYIEKIGDKFHAYPVGGRCRTFASFECAKYYIHTGKAIIHYVEEIPQIKLRLENQLTLF